MSKRKTSADGTILRACFAASFERAASQDGRFRIRGVANTFGVMRSGRMFHPKAFDKWLAANGQPNLALLGNHGFDVAGFASIGRVDGVQVGKQGLIFGAWIGEATQLARDARALVEEGTLKGISVGWMSRGMASVRIDDPNLDPAALYLSTGRVPDGGCCGSTSAYRGGEHDGSPPRDLAEAERRAFPNGRFDADEYLSDADEASMSLAGLATRRELAAALDSLRTARPGAFEIVRAACRGDAGEAPERIRRELAEDETLEHVREALAGVDDGAPGDSRLSALRELRARLG